MSPMTKLAFGSKANEPPNSAPAPVSIAIKKIEIVFIWPPDHFLHCTYQTNLMI